MTITSDFSTPEFINDILNNVTKTISYVDGNKLYLALFVRDESNPTDSANVVANLKSGVLSNEVGNGKGYSRQVIQYNNTYTYSSSENANVNIVANVTFGNATADWGVISHYALLDGNNKVIVYGAMDGEQKFMTNDSVKFTSLKFTGYGATTKTASGAAMTSLLGNTSLNVGPGHTVRLFKASATESNIANAIGSEDFSQQITGGGYSAVTKTTLFANTSSDIATNDQTVTFPTATSDWEKAGWVVLGNATYNYYYAKLASPITCKAGESIIFEPGSLKFKLL